MRRELTKEERLRLGIDDNHPAQAFARHFANPDGTYTTEVHLKPIRYRANDDWADIDPTIEDEPGFGRKVKKAWHNLRFWDKKLRFGFGKGVFVDYTLPGDPVFTADTATIADAWPQVDLVYKSLPEGVKADFILKSATAPNVFVFPVALSGVSATINGNTLDYVETLTGKVVGQVRPPFAIDANGVKGEVALSWDGQAITFTVDKTWLDGPERAWPVIVDPTTTITINTDSSGQDTHVFSNSSYVNTNFGSSPTLSVGYQTGTEPGKNYILVQFDLSTLPSSSQILSATLQLINSGSYTGTPLAAYRILNSWSYLTATWDNQPATNVNYESLINAVTGINSWDLTSAVKNWASGAWANYGVKIKETPEQTSVFSVIGFRSSNYSDTTKRPKLVIIHSTPPIVSISAPSGTQDSPITYRDNIAINLIGAYSDAEGETLTYGQWQVFDESNNLVYDSGKISATNPSHTIPTGKLVYGKKYYWRWMAWDSAGAYSNWSSTGWFQCEMTAPTGLVLSSNPNSASITLSWDAHPAEGLAGYNVYRRKAGGTTWVKQNQTVVAGTSYTDDFAAGGVAYEYQVTAVSTTGYESPASASVQGSVTVTDWWLGAVKLDSVTAFNFSQGRKQTIQNVWGKDYPLVQDFGKTGKQLHLKATIRGESNYQIFEEQWKQTAVMGLRDPFGRAWKAKPVGEIQAEQMRGTGQADYIVSFTLREVAG